jgi:hypothetical protein
MMVVSLYPDEVLATTCSIPNTFTTGQIPTAAMFNDNWSAACTVINGQITGDNIAVGANIPFSKLADIDHATNGSAIFIDHSARHEPGGADVMDDITFSDGGLENASLHAARHANGGQDPMPADSISSSMLEAGIINLTNRAQQINEIAQQQDVTYTGSNNLRFDSGVVVGEVPVDMVTCGGFVYVLIDTSGVDKVVKLTPSDMSSVNINMAGGDNPRDIECASTDALYVLTNGGSGNIKIKQITSGDVHSEFADLADAGVTPDVGLQLAIDDTTTFMWAIASTDAENNVRSIFRIRVSDQTVTVLQISGNDEDDMRDLFFADIAGNDRIVVLKRDRVGVTDCNLHTFTTAGPPAADQTIVFDNTNYTFSNAYRCNGMAFDGQNIWMPGLADDDSTYNFTLFDMTNMQRYGAIGLIGQTASEVVSSHPNLMHFDGEQVLFLQTFDEGGTNGELNIAQPPHYKAAGVIEGLDFSGALAGADEVPCGVASDGTFAYICHHNVAGTKWVVNKLLL